MGQREATLITARIAKAARAQAGTGALGTAVMGDVGPKAVGVLHVQIRPADKADDPNAWETHEIDGNLVVTQAEGLMANAMGAVVNNTINYIELGDPAPATTPVLADIVLEQTTAERKVVVVTVSGNTLTAEATWLVAEGNGFTYTEAGLFVGLLGAGSMFARKVFSGITKTAAFELKFTWLITFLVATTSGNDCAGVALVGPSTVANETIFTAVGAEASVAATFDFAVGAARLDVFLNGVRLVRGVHYIEAPAPLTAPIGGPAGNKGVNLVGFTLSGPVGPNPADVVYLVHRAVG